ncbi:DNA-directed RNA polymerase IV subunit 1 isoform X2 [Impatiens glandulifera]|uniref:DNA-directed RNA polymerase IV subunit 1 isoform X2 n=1 Tax=Impatiens glandulifera TaxID=253017 RepID=UPI001FB1250F|nr:DNA-directed RNA polymerase IV subunit 1 isoform X2 [Impatiens glandulifera]
MSHSMDHSLVEEQYVPAGRLTGISLSVLTDSDAEMISALSVEVAGEVTDAKLGLPNPTSQCSTCGANSLKNCEGHFGVIKFPFAILHPYLLSETVRVLNRICPSCKVLRSNQGAGSRPRSYCRYCDARFRNCYPKLKFKVSSTDLFGKTAIIAEVQETKTRLSRTNPSEGLATDFWDFVPKDSQQDQASLKPNIRVLSHFQVYHILKDINQDFLKEFVTKRSSLFLNSFLVPPNCHRVSEMGENVAFDDRTRHFKKLVDFRGTGNELSSGVLECLKASKICAEKFDSTSGRPGRDQSLNMSGSKHMKDILLSKRSDHAFRMVVVGDPNIKLSEIGIPRHIADSLHVSESLTAWNWENLSTYCNLRIIEKGESHIRRKGDIMQIRIMDKLEMGDVIYRPMNDGDILLIDRPPSIHQHSLIALSAKILPTNSALSINPLICSPFRGDFDGDCLHGYVPQSLNTRVELLELVALDKQLINGQTGKNLLSLSQDSLTAAYLIVQDGVLFNRFQMQQLQMFCLRSQPSQSHNDGLWTGKQLFSLLFPEDFNYVCPDEKFRIQNGDIISSSDGSPWLKDSDGNVFQSLIKNCGPKTLEFLFSAQEVLCQWLLMRGLSVSLSDLYLSHDSRENMIEEILFGLKEAELSAHLQLLMLDSNRDFLISSDEIENHPDMDTERMCYLKQKSAALSQLAVSAIKRVSSDIQSLVYSYASKDNSFMAMLKAGSKGNVMKLVQHSMCLGLQNSLVPLSFRVPHELTCEAWNRSKNESMFSNGNNSSYIPFAVVKSSFLTGLNPLEAFVHSLTARDSSFSDNADLPGTLSRRLMYFMRDLCIGYDRTVRNTYGNHLIQFSYNSEADSEGGHPVGSLAACAISEAAYSALDQPVSIVETSPLLNLKKVLECGVKKRTGAKTATLFFSKIVKTSRHGSEYAAVDVQSYLERVILSDVVYTTMICFHPKSSGGNKNDGSWVCHFHISKVVKRRKLNILYVIRALRSGYRSIRAKSKVNLPMVYINKEDLCSVDNKQTRKPDTMFCITARTDELSPNSKEHIEIFKRIVMRPLLQTVIKGFPAIKKVEILWKDDPNIKKSRQTSSGELYLKVSMSQNCDRTKFWNVLVDNCLQIMDAIDWDRSHPDDINDIALAFGIDVAWKYFLINLKSAISDTGKAILPRHLLLAADCLSSTGEFVSLNAKGLTDQRRDMSVSSPFTLACFSNPANTLIKAAKKGVDDKLEGSIDALSWGKTPCLGTGGPFDIIYSGMVHEVSKPTGIYKLLSAQNTTSEQVKLPQEKTESRFGQSLLKILPRELAVKGPKSLDLKKFISLKDIQKLSKELRTILHHSPINHALSDVDKDVVMMALFFHPKREEKIGIGEKEIKVGYHSGHEASRCFLLVRMDDTVEDFSYHKCIKHALEIVAPERAKTYENGFKAAGEQTKNTPTRT